MPRILLSILVLLVAQHATAAQPAAKKATPVAKIVVVQPQADQQLTGTADVRIKVEVPEGATDPNAVYVGLGGAPWTGLKQDSGEWTAQIDTTLVPNGTQKLIVTTDNKRANTSINVTVANPLKVFFADLHAHTSYSDGTLIPAVAHEYARNIAKLDVFCLTDHQAAVDDNEWLDMREVAFDANEDGTFVAFPGLEWTKKWGHINIYDPKTRIWPADPQEFYKAAAEAGVTTKFNHPGDGTVSHDGLAYSEVGDKSVELMEVRQAKEEQAFIRALNLGWHLAPDGSDDTHSPNWGNVKSWTGILAPGLTKRNILDALARRHCYSTLDRNCVLTFTVNGASMGDIISEPVKEVKAAVVVDDGDENDATAKIELFEDGVVVQTHEADTTDCRWETTCTPKPGKHYFFVKLTQADGNLLWSAPVWVTVAE
ncbi:MAG: CehA/McbA family metallohydrolase [Planctomycetaceae bacterium]|nr:CehA/McbA family metallohydrolase [Planctomycetaceae bacterium]